MERIATNPDLFSDDLITTKPPPLTVTRLQNQWQREICKVQPEQTNAQKLLYQLVAEKYASIEDTP